MTLVINGHTDFVSPLILNSNSQAHVFTNFPRRNFDKNRARFLVRIQGKSNPDDPHSRPFPPNFDEAHFCFKFTTR